MRLPISGIYKIKGVGDVLAGRVEQGIVKPNEEVVFMPTHTAANECAGKVFTIEMHHTRHEVAKPGDNVGLNIKGLDKTNMPRVGDVMIYDTDKTLQETGEFNAQIQTLDIPGEIKVGYSPIGFVRCGHAACRAMSFVFKVGKETGSPRNTARCVCPTRGPLRTAALNGRLQQNGLRPETYSHAGAWGNQFEEHFLPHQRNGNFGRC